MSDPHTTPSRAGFINGGTDTKTERDLAEARAAGSSAAKPDCPHCGGSGVVEIQSSGNREIGFDREWDDCDCKYEDATPDRAATEFQVARLQRGRVATWITLKFAEPTMDNEFYRRVWGDEYDRIVQQLWTDAVHSSLLWRLFNGEEPRA